MPEVPPDVPPPIAQSRLKRLAVLGSVWTIGGGLATRMLGVVGTLVLTRFIAPYDYGEVSAATVILMTANQLSTIGISSYMIAHPKAGRDILFHLSVVHIVTGVLGFGVALAIGARLGPHLDAPTVGRYLTGIAIALMIDRISLMPERVLVRSMRFGQITIGRTAGDIVYTVVSVGTAMRGWGGMAVVAGNLGRSATRFVCLQVFVHWREWLEPARLRTPVLKDIFRFAVGVYVAALGGFGLRRWDNLIVSRLWGPATLGAYNLAYNLADIPAVQVGEQVSDVLQSAFARYEGTDRVGALLRSTKLLAFIMTPMAVGLGCIAPTLASTIFDKRWAEVGPMLMALSVISFPRPISGTIVGYLFVLGRSGIVAAMEMITLLLMVVSLFTIGRISPLGPCIAVGVTFVVRLILSGVILKMVAAVPLGRFLMPLIPPILASVPMAAAVIGTHIALAPAHLRVTGLVCEIVAGSIGYAVGALLFARSQLRELLSLARNLRRK